MMLTSTEVWTCTSLHLNHTLNPRAPVFTEGRQLVRTTTKVRGCYHRSNSSVKTVTDNKENLTTRRIWQHGESGNKENLTTIHSLQPQSERELVLSHNTVAMSQLSPHKNNESV